MIDLTVFQNTGCRMCPIGNVTTKAPKNRCIMPKTAEEVDVLLVGSEPTLSEDMQARPFAEKYAASLVKQVESWGVTVQTALGVKCIWQQKSTMPARAITTCAQAYLGHEIEAAKPKHIIVFGATAWKAVTGSPTGFKQAESQRVWNEKLKAYIYVTGTLKVAAFKVESREKIDADMVNFRRWITNEDTHREFSPTIQVVESLTAFREMLEDLSQYDTIAADLETSGLDYFDPKHYVRTIQFCGDPDDVSYVVPLRLGEGCFFGHLLPWTQLARREKRVGTGEPRALTYNKALAITSYEQYLTECPNGYFVKDRLWSDKGYAEVLEGIRSLLVVKKMIWHNGKFDRLFLKAWGERETGTPIEAPYIFMDTLHVAFLLNENRELGLKRLITTELGIPTYNIKDKVTPNLDDLIPYAGADTAATYLLAEHFREQMREEENLDLWKLYVHLLRKADSAYTDIESRGWPVNLVVANEIAAVLVAEAEGYEETMRKYLNENGITEEVTYSAPQQIGDILFNRLRLPQNEDKSIALTPTGGFSVDEDALFHLLEAKNPFVVALLKWRGVQKALSTYVYPMIASGQNRGRLTTTYKLTGTVTGRTASGKEGSDSSGMNLQNLPHAWEIRRIVRPEKGKVIIEADLSQIELRIAAELSGDKLLLDTYRNNRDLHTLRGQRIRKVDEEQWYELDEWDRDDARSKAKPVNFGFLYGMSWRKFIQYALIQYNIRFSTKEATQIRETFFDDHSGLTPWYARQQRQAERLGYVVSLSGRKRRLPNAQLPEHASGMLQTSRADAMRQAINTPVQGFASDLKVMAVVELNDILKSQYGEDRARVIGEIHDSILIECDEDLAIELSQLAVKVMRHPQILDRMGITLNVPIDAEAKYGPSLYKKEMVKVKV